MNKEDYEKLKKIEAKINRIDRFFIDSKRYRYIVLAEKPVSGVDFWEQGEKDKRSNRIIPVASLPDGLGIYEFVLQVIEDERKKLQQEFQNILNK